MCVHFFIAFKLNERNKLMNINGWEMKAKGFHKSNKSIDFPLKVVCLDLQAS